MKLVWMKDILLFYALCDDYPLIRRCCTETMDSVKDVADIPQRFVKEGTQVRAFDVAVSCTR